MSCPMKIEKELSEKQIKYFCSFGCSPECNKFLKEYKKRISKNPKNPKVKYYYDNKQNYN